MAKIASPKRLLIYSSTQQVIGEEESKMGGDGDDGAGGGAVRVGGEGTSPMPTPFFGLIGL
jgi:hypothetical protein